MNSDTDVVDDMRLVGDLGDLDADRKLGSDRVHGGSRLLPSARMLAPSSMETPSPRAGLPPSRTMKVGRVLVAALDRRNVAKPEHASVRFDRHGATASTPVNAPVTRRWMRSAVVSTEPPDGDGVLLGDAIEDLLRRKTERGEFPMAELDEDLLRPLADDVDLVDIGHAQQALANVLGAVLELGEAHAVGASACRWQNRRRRIRH